MPDTESCGWPSAGRAAVARRRKCHRIMGLTEFHGSCYGCTLALFPAAHHSLRWRCSLRTSGLVLPGPATVQDGEAPVRTAISIFDSSRRQPGLEGRAADARGVLGDLVGHHPVQALVAGAGRAPVAAFLDVFRKSSKFSEVQAVCKNLNHSPLVGVFQAGYAELNTQLRPEAKTAGSPASPAPRPTLKSLPALDRALLRASSVEVNRLEDASRFWPPPPASRPTSACSARCGAS